MNYAIVKSGGKQYLVKENDTITIDRLGTDAKEIEFNQVLLVNKSGNVQIGRPFVESKVKGELVEHSRGKKIRVARFKAKSNYRRVQGHRSELTTVKITSI